MLFGGEWSATLGGKLGHWPRGRSMWLGASLTHSMFCNEFSFNKTFSPSVVLEIPKSDPYLPAFSRIAFVAYCNLTDCVGCLGYVFAYL